MIVGSTFAVRCAELAFLAAWLVGFSLVWKHTRRTLLLGVYVGCTLSWIHDWILAGPEIWRMDFHPDTIWIATWGERSEGLWAPLSYGAFFGIGTFVWLRYLEAPLKARLGAWRFGLIFPAAFAGNVIVEGTLIELTDANRYHQAGNWLVFNIPWLHLVTTGLMFGGIIFGAVQGLKVLDHFGWHDLEPAPRKWRRLKPAEREAALVGAAHYAAPTPRREVLVPAGGSAPGTDAPPSAAEEERVPAGVRRAMFLVGVALPQAAFTAATMVGLYLYDWIGVPGGQP